MAARAGYIAAIIQRFTCCRHDLARLRDIGNDSILFARIIIDHSPDDSREQAASDSR